MYKLVDNEAMCYRSEPVNIRKRKMESSTPMTWRKEKKFMADLESPIDHETREEKIDTSEESYGEVIMDENPTGVSDDLQSKHLTPLKSENSSLENKQLYTTTRNWSIAAMGCGYLKRSTSMPNIADPIEDNYFAKRSPGKNTLRRTMSASKLLEGLNLNLNGGGSHINDEKDEHVKENQDLQGASCGFQTPLNGSEEKKNLQGQKCV